MTKMHPSTARLYQAAKRAGLLAETNQLTDLARLLNASVQKVKNWGARGVSRQGALDAQEAFGVSATWVMEGTGEMFVAGARSSVPAAVAAVHGARDQIAVWNHPDDLPPDDGRVWIDRFDYACSAGDGIIQWEVRQKRALPFTSDFFRAIGAKPDTCKLVTVRGPSMEPFLFDRDMIMVDTSRTAVRDGKIYAVFFEGESLVKQVFKEAGGALKLHSYNPAFPDKVVPPHDGVSFTVVGEVVYRSGSGWSAG